MAVARLVTGLAHELRDTGIAVVGIVPGFTRTEAVVDAFAAEGMDPPAAAHSPEYVGRAVVCVTADPDAASLSGASLQTATLGERYGFVDVDGRSFAPFRMPDENRLPQ